MTYRLFKPFSASLTSLSDDFLAVVGNVLRVAKKQVAGSDSF